MCHPRILSQGDYVPQLTIIFKFMHIFTLMDLEESVANICPIKYIKS